MSTDAQPPAATQPTEQVSGNHEFPVVGIGASGTYLGHVGVSPDITASVEAEEALKDADQRKDEFLATLAHELRNPLAAIRPALEVLRRGDKKKGKAAQQVIERQLG